MSAAKAIGLTGLTLVLAFAAAGTGHAVTMKMVDAYDSYQDSRREKGASDRVAAMSLLKSKDSPYKKRRLYYQGIAPAGYCEKTPYPLYRDLYKIYERPSGILKDVTVCHDGSEDGKKVKGVIRTLETSRPVRAWLKPAKN